MSKRECRTGHINVFRDSMRGPIKMEINIVDQLFVKTDVKETHFFVSEA